MYNITFVYALWFHITINYIVIIINNQISDNTQSHITFRNRGIDANHATFLLCWIFMYIGEIGMTMKEMDERFQKLSKQSYCSYRG